MAKEQVITIHSKVYDGPDRETRINMIYEKLLRWTLEKKAAQKGELPVQQSIIAQAK